MKRAVWRVGASFLMLSFIGSILGCGVTNKEFLDDETTSLSYVTSHDGSSVALRVYPSGIHEIAEGRTRVLIDLLAPQGVVRQADTQFPTSEIDYSELPSSSALNALYERLNQSQTDVAIIMVALPGTFGSEGEFSQSDDWSGVDMVNQVINQLQSEIDAQHWGVAGHSAAGRVAGGLLWRRDDLTCTVLGHTITHMDQELARRNWSISYTGSSEPIDLMQRIEELAVVEGRRVLLLSDRKDGRVPFEDSSVFVDALRERNHGAELYEFNSPGPDHHGSAAITRQVGVQCLQGWSL